VTKGLDASVPSKASGVEWLGEVPAHWDVSALSYLSFIETGSTPDRGDPRYWNGMIPWLKTGEINWAPIREAEEFITEEGLANSAAKLSKPGTLLMAMYGQGVTRGRVALLEIEAAYNQACAAIAFGPRILPEFGRYFFMAAYDHIREGGNETSQMNLSAGLIAKFRLTVPPTGEQARIVRWLDSELSQLEVLGGEADKAISLLQERRSALISAAVTGQIDVRHLAPQEAA
jgi:type I restriction enzyme S subunit